MKKSLKILLVLAGILVLTAIALSVFVRFYLTDERIRTMVIPPAEQALARKVTIGDIKVSLLSGITVNNFAIKEADNASDFIKAKAFIIRYKLFPLLSKEVVVSEISLLEPAVRIHRDQKGNFNFESLGILAAKEKSDQEQAPTGTQAAALPIALTVDKIKVQNIKITVTDAKNELPQVTTLADLTVGLDIKNLTNILYDGSLQFTTDVVYGKVKPHLTGSCVFDQKQLSVQADIAVDNEQLHLDGSIKDYTATPNIRLDLSSTKLNIDHLLAIVAGLPKAAQQAQQSTKSSKIPQEPIAKSLPQGLVLNGQIKVDQVNYNELAINNFHLTYGLKDGIFSISKMESMVAGGPVKASGLEADLNNPALSYQGKAEVNGLKVGELLTALKPKTSGVINGTAATSMNFSGSGTEWQEIKKNLTMDAIYSLSQCTVKNNDITKKVSALIGLQELNNLSFDEIDGNIKIQNGMAQVSSQMNGPELKINTKGTISLDGDLNLPLTIILSPALSDKLRQRASIARYLADEQGQTSLRLTILGTVDKPRPTLDESAVKEQAEKVIKNKLLEELGKAVGGGEEESQPSDQEGNPAKDLLKGLLGF
jgi:uncharacterized protein involved in outer membrane biogenesis